MSQPLHNKCAMLLDVHITLILCSQQWINPWKLFVELYTFLDGTVHFEILISTDLKNVQTHTHISVNANILTFVLQCADSERWVSRKGCCTCQMCLFSILNQHNSHLDTISIELESLIRYIMQMLFTVSVQMIWKQLFAKSKDSLKPTDNPATVA